VCDFQINQRPVHSGQIIIALFLIFVENLFALKCKIKNDDFEKKMNR